MNIFQQKSSQLSNSQAKTATKVAQKATSTSTVNTMSMYQPSISFLSKPITSYGNNNVKKQQQLQLQHQVQTSLNTTIDKTNQSKNQVGKLTNENKVAHTPKAIILNL